jgi:hypothetical protein
MTELERLFSPDVLAALRALVDARVEERLGAATPAAADSRFLTVKEAAHLSGHPEGTLRKWLQRGTLRNYGRPRAPRVKLSDILNLSQ